MSSFLSVEGWEEADDLQKLLASGGLLELLVSNSLSRGIQMEDPKNVSMMYVLQLKFLLFFVFFCS